ncbi:hypothetical protein CANARDRAFT_9062 [[Candida] arabinofermentans NRRL YB-2248]|uniref:Uncharacterized protein n=1 Tax=[Candida] arabinofermentans NRRL YB-2248 TaxID=983967 RepID=A0A1E4SX50_9ASCO|nr:hypothetical protein CANARDRAFT_9062 [[Candida] arabinofermentans NRRL YB-2248]
MTEVIFFQDDQLFTENTGITNLLRFDTSNKSTGSTFPQSKIVTPSLQSTIISSKSACFSRSSLMRHKLSPDLIPPSLCSSCTISLESYKSPLHTPLLTETTLVDIYQTSYFDINYRLDDTADDNSFTFPFSFNNLEVQPILNDDHPLAIVDSTDSKFVKPNVSEVSKTSALKSNLTEALINCKSRLESKASSLINSLFTSDMSDFENLSPFEKKIRLLNETEIPLTTFKITYDTIGQDWNNNNGSCEDNIRLSNGSFKSPLRHREARLNPQFLRIYALDTSARFENCLPVTDYEVDIYEDYCQNEKVNSDRDEIESIDSYCSSLCTEDEEDDDDFLGCFDNRFTSDQKRKKLELIKIASISRHKLWNNVILNPRADCPLHESHYIAVNEACESSNTRKQEQLPIKRKSLPWLNLSDATTIATSNKLSNKPFSLKSHGYLSNSYGIQYVVKGYVNERWIAN